MRLACLIVAALGAAAPTFADASKLKPAGWTAEQSSYTEAWTFTSADETSEAKVIHFEKLALEELGEIAARQMKPYSADEIKREGPERIGAALVYTAGYRDEDTGEFYLGMAMAAPHGLGGTLTCYIHAPMVNGAASPVLAAYITGCADFASAGTPYDEEKGRLAARRAAIAAVPIKAGKGRPVEAVLFDVYYISGVGGMVLPDYRPVVLFKDGVACNCLDVPAGDIDPAAAAKSDPDSVGRWTRKGNAYLISWPDDEEPTEIAGDFERPAAYGKDHRLDGYWVRLSGGGNTAMGGEVMVSNTDSFRFFKDGSFDNSNTFGGSAPGVVVAGSGGRAGKYRIDGDALTLSFANGETRRTSLYAGKGEDPVLWIGGESFVSR